MADPNLPPPRPFEVRKEGNHWAVYDEHAQFWTRFAAHQEAAARQLAARAQQRHAAMYGTPAPPPTPTFATPPPAPVTPAPGPAPVVPGPVPTPTPAGAGWTPVAPVPLSAFPPNMQPGGAIPPPPPLSAPPPPPVTPTPPTQGGGSRGSRGRGWRRAWRLFRRHRITPAWNRFRAAAPHAAAFGGTRGLMGAGFGALAATNPEILAVVAGVEVLRSIPRLLREFAEGIHDANRELIPFAPRLALAEVRLQMGDFRRTMGLARATEPTAATLTQSINEMRTALFPFQVAGRNAQNMLGTAAAGVTTGGANQLQPLADLGEHLRRALDPTGERTQAVAEAVGAAIVNTITGYLGPIVNQINQLLGVQQIQPGAGVQGPWDAMITHEAGANRLQPLHGLNRPFNPAERWP